MPSTLVDADTLAARLGDPGWVVVDCRFTVGAPGAGEAAHAVSRIPGARYAHLERDLSGPGVAALGRNPLPAPSALAAAFGRWGISRNTQVVAYDDSFGSVAARLWWLLRHFGHPRVALLDGGWPTWKRRKLPIDSAPPTGRPDPVPAAPDTDPVAAAPARIPPVSPGAAARGADAGIATGLADTAFVDRIRSDPAWRLLDARPEERFTGEHETVDPVGGHIPGARFATWEDNLALDGRFLPPDELRARFAELLGDVPPTRVVHTCGSGVTACHNLLAMEHAGLSGSRLHPESWSGWIADPTHPVATGPQ